jgi:hypothetical protein
MVLPTQTRCAVESGMVLPTQTPATLWKEAWCFPHKHKLLCGKWHGASHTNTSYSVESGMVLPTQTQATLWKVAWCFPLKHKLLCGKWHCASHTNTLLCGKWHGASHTNTLLCGKWHGASYVTSNCRATNTSNHQTGMTGDLCDAIRNGKLKVPVSLRSYLFIFKLRGFAWLLGHAVFYSLPHCCHNVWTGLAESITISHVSFSEFLTNWIFCVCSYVLCGWNAGFLRC